MTNLQELQNQLNSIEELLVLLVNVADKKVPQLRDDINDITKNIKNGFDKEELAKQIRSVLNQVINQSDYTKLEENISTTAQKMTQAIEKSSQQVNEWEKNYQVRSTWYFSLISLILGVGIGITISYCITMDKFKQYQNFAIATGEYVKYINSSCKIKKDFNNFFKGNKKFDCSQDWPSGTDFIN